MKKFFVEAEGTTTYFRVWDLETHEQHRIGVLFPELDPQKWRDLIGKTITVDARDLIPYMDIVSSSDIQVEEVK